jgi:hypothetical protein
VVHVGVGTMGVSVSKAWAGRNNGICFKDRRAVRVLKWGDSARRCPDCGGGLINMGDKLRVPKRNDDQGWKEYEARYLAWRARVGKGST